MRQAWIERPGLAVSRSCRSPVSVRLAVSWWAGGDVSASSQLGGDIVQIRGNSVILTP